MTGRRGAVRRVLRSLGPLARFEAVYKMAAGLVLVPLFCASVWLDMEISGYVYLTHENISSFLTHPLTIFTAGANLLLGAACAAVDVSAVAFALDQAARGNAVTAGGIFRAALQNTARALRRENLPAIPAALLLLPLVYVGPAAGALTVVRIPAAVMRYLRAHPGLPLGAVAALALMTTLGVRRLYAFFCFTAEGCGYAAARRRDAALGGKRRLRDLGALLAAQAVFAGLCVALLLAAMAAAGLLGRALSAVLLQRWRGPSAVWLGIVLTLSVLAALAVPVGYGFVGALYCRRRAGAPGEASRFVPAPRERTGRRRGFGLLRAGAVCALAAGDLVLIFLFGTGGINPEIESLHTMEITAHRGASAFYPENTMAAFQGALELGADWIELDVQQTGDGQLIVLHDAELKRTTGASGAAWSMTARQIRALDAGSFFGPEWAGERIPFLEEVLAFAKESGMKLNIELKPTGHETDLERQVVDAIRAAELENDCVITSQAYGVLERVKAYDPSMTTVYVMSLAYGSIGQLSAADHFSVAARSVTGQLVSRVHNAGKQLYVWTVNDRAGIMRMLELGVDNIITDDIDLAKQCLYESRYSDPLEEYAANSPA